MLRATEEAGVLALVIVLTVVVALLAVLVMGLLRSHADIVRALHTLGVGVGDPALAAGHGGVGPTPVALSGRPTHGSGLPPERGAGVHDLAGTTPGGDAVVASVGSAGLLLVVFLSSGCSSCAAIWSALADRSQTALLGAGTRIVVVTKGPELESPDTVGAAAPAGVTVVMSTEAWVDYEVPGSPFFVLVDGVTGRRVGEGVVQSLAQLADMVRRADVDVRPPVSTGAGGRRPAATPWGAEREADNDARLAAAGIGPDHPSLHPRSLDDLFASTAQGTAPGPGAGPLTSGAR